MLDEPLWFTEQGFDTLQKEREASLAAAAEDANAFERFVSPFPKAARKQFNTAASWTMFRPSDPRSIANEGSEDSEDKDVGARIARAVGNGQALAAMVCRAFGTQTGDDQIWFQSTHPPAAID